MNFLYPPKPKRSKTPARLLIVCLFFSILFHIAVILLLPLLQPEEQAPLLQQQPTLVQLVDLPPKTERPQADKPREFEIDPVPIKPQPLEPVESFRKADRDQKVDQEQAPKGDDVRDQSTQKPQLPSPARPQPMPQSKPVQEPQPQPQQQSPRTEATSSQQQAAKASTPPPSQPDPVSPPQKQLSPQHLFPDARTLSEIARGSHGDRNRVKQRQDVEIGDEVWLNLQNDLLVSFFRRFHDKIELVWNYPIEAANNGIEGTLQLMIIVNPKGELLDVDVKQSSGSDLLDYEAIQAVYRAAPFGPLTKHYPHDKLKINAYFSYRLSGKIIYGRGY
ncbi:protein TonB [Desulfuromusa kysingii]|uniref:Protein TonB n=1 Tax=Desulfuromusa kysingii TaxID=37625 RepID=A0A1H3YPF6_9BACT|nr:energy transducer TonB [Desulfuromusa kysingii]SEA13383.1 protein TonB [Desulfuromusa kysingii]